MKTLATRPPADAAPADGTPAPMLPPALGDTAAIVRLAGHGAADGMFGAAADGQALGAAAADPVTRARGFAEPLLAGQQLDTGEDALAHADGVAALLHAIGAAPSMRAAAYLVYAGDYLQRPEEVVAKAFGESAASLVTLTRKLVQIQRAARSAVVGAEQQALQTERVRKMLLAFSRDLRVVLLRLASRLQTLRWFAASRTPCPEALARESLHVFAPLANRLGIWQIKWEIEDLAFRFLQPADYKQVAGLLDQTRVEREAGIAAARTALMQRLAEAGLRADVQGRPKHLYSIWKKMQGKGLGFERVFDLRALRVVVDDVGDCYAALARVHECFTPVSGEFDDYIAKPKPNGYQSLHTVVLGDDGRPLEVQVRTRAMHEHAEHGVAAHWMYKEAGVRGYGGVSGIKAGGGIAAAGDFEERIAEARKAVLRELLAWERDTTQDAAAAARAGGVAFDDRIYVFTPQATIIDLPVGATPVDFAYSLHTDLGHRCRGARVDGAMVPLNTALRSGQTVEVISSKEGGPSLDWLNAELGYLKSPRAKAKVRAWFNAQAQAATIARGRELVEKLLQREGRTAMKLDALAEQLGFKQADQLFEVVGKDELSLRTIEALLRPSDPAPADDGFALRRARSEAGGGRGGVLVVGVESLMTTLARCCRPAPPDAIGGYVTRGQGVAIHRRGCSNFVQMAARSPGRIIEVEWGRPAGDREKVYPLDVLIEASDRQGLLRDISEVFAKNRMNVTGVHTQSAKDRGTAWMTFTVEAADAARLAHVLAMVARVPGVRHARRK
jgi:GTP pyrophosphokinase